MPIILLIAGITLIISAVRDSQDDYFTLLKGDFTGENNFIYWFAAIFLIGALGYFKSLKSFSNAMLVLVILVVFLAPKNQGFFKQFVDAISQTKGSTNNG